MKKAWSKSIIIISVRRREGKKDGWKGNAKVDYEVVTQTHVTLDASSCTVRRVTELLRRQLDMEVVLLDSKCYPLAQNESPSNESFWKSSRKILAANKSLYDKVSGQSTNVGRASIDLTKGDTIEELDSSSATHCTHMHILHTCHCYTHILYTHHTHYCVPVILCTDVETITRSDQK